MRTLLRIIDAISDYTGRAVHYLCAILVVVLTYEVTMRYVFNAPTMWAHQFSMILTGALIAMGWAYVHRYREHVRVDVIYTRFSPRKKAFIDVIGYLLLFFPLLFAVTFDAWKEMWYSWEAHEVMTETYWFPPVGPSRTIVFVGLLLLAFQGVANFIRDLHLLTRGKPYD